MRRRVFLRVFLAVAMVALLLGFGVYENRAIQTEEMTVTDAALPEAFSGLRLVLLTDLHGREFGKGNVRLLNAVTAAKPDLILLGGDLIEKTEQLQIAETLALGLVKLAPVFYVTGNHEWASGAARPLKTLLDNCGVTVLENDWRILRREGQSIALVGLNDPNGPYDQPSPETVLEELRQAEGEDVWTMLLYHRNDSLLQWSSLGIHLVLCGHSHGGLIRIPFLGGLFGSGGQFLPDFDAGLFSQNQTQMLVSRGLGGFPRLGNRPQVLVVTLERGEGSGG